MKFWQDFMRRLLATVRSANCLLVVTPCSKFLCKANLIAVALYLMEIHASSVSLLIRKSHFNCQTDFLCDHVF